MPIKKTLMYRWFNGLWNEGKLETIDKLMHTDAVAHGIQFREFSEGTEGIKQFYADFTSKFDDIKVTVDHVISEHDYEAARLQVIAHHKESGKMVSVPGISMCRIKDGKIAEAWNNFDYLAMYQQLGMKLG